MGFTSVCVIWSVRDDLTNLQDMMWCINMQLLYSNFLSGLHLFDV